MLLLITGFLILGISPNFSHAVEKRGGKAESGRRWGWIRHAVEELS
jgi:hypothetical protein